jgi:hypothetical protein
MMQCSQIKFRSNDNLDQYMYRYWQLIHENFYPYKHNDELISNLDSPKVLDKMIQRLKRDKHINFVCFNDSTKLDDTQYETIRQGLQDFLEQRFSEKASFEF